MLIPDTTGSWKGSEKDNVFLGRIAGSLPSILLVISYFVNLTYFPLCNPKLFKTLSSTLHDLYYTLKSSIILNSLSISILHHLIASTFLSSCFSSFYATADVSSFIYYLPHFCLPPFLYKHFPDIYSLFYLYYIITYLLLSTIFLI